MTSRGKLPLLIAGLGAIYMAGLAFGLILAPEYPFMGYRIYDLYAEALLDGRFDLPAYELRFEGHYTPDGTGYLYHGLGPILTRLPFAPFVDFPTSWIAPLSIWFWSVLGNVAYHRAFSLALDKAEFEASPVPRSVRTLLAVAVWFASPGILLTANGSLYYEPIAIAYACGGGFVLVVAMLHFGLIAAKTALAPLAIVAGLVVHARPHLALGFYAGACMLAATVALRGGWAGRARAGIALVLLALSGGLLIGSNALRSNDLAAMHGSFGKSELQYGTVYWGYEQPDSRRARTFEEHGRFNPGRVIPNALIYLAAPPSLNVMDPAKEAIEGLHRSLTSSLGFVRIEEPKTGALYLWPVWLLLMVVGLSRRELWRMPALAGTLAVLAGGVLMLSYGTITLRYHVDLWPMIAFPAVFGIGPVYRWFAEPSRNALLGKVLLPGLLVLGLAASGLTVIESHLRLLERPGTMTRPWSPAYCLRMTARHGFSTQRSREICGLKQAGHASR